MESIHLGQIILELWMVEFSWITESSQFLLQKYFFVG